MYLTTFTEYLLCALCIFSLVGGGLAFDSGSMLAGWGAPKDQAGLLGAKGKDQLLGQEGLSGQRPVVAWF